MNTATASFPRTSPSPAPALARRVLALLARLAVGTLEIELPDGSLRRFGGPAGPRAAMQVLDWRAFSRAATAGDIGFAEGYIEGEWTTPDLAALLDLVVANREALEQAVYGSWWGGLAYRLRHLLNRNSRRGSARNIHAHYDLGNEFYRLWLDETMSYSAALFEGDAARPLPEAQRAKVRRALREAGVGPGSRVLEIGCGWGGLAEIAALEFGAHVTGVTLSREQLEWAQRRAEAGGWADRADLRYQDYRDLPAEFDAKPFDAIVSIEMFEAVGREYWRGYFEVLRQCLRPGGLACIQSITIRDDLFARYVRSTDFIQQYIFPGGLLPSPTAFRDEARRGGFDVHRELAFGTDYARTLKLWRDRFEAHESTVRQQGFDERFMRIWRFYLCYCEAAFARGNTDVVQFTLARA